MSALHQTSPSVFVRALSLPGLGFLAVFLVVGSAGCVASLTAAGAKARITTAEPRGCKYLGEIHGIGNAGTVSTNIESARNKLRNQAGEMGGNVVHLQTNNQTGARVDMTGVAFKCPDAP